MKENLLFANTCGKIYADIVILAFENREKEIYREEIRKIKTKAGIKLKSLFIMLIPSSFLIFLYAIHELEITLRFVIWSLTIFFTGLSILNVQKTFHIIIVMKDKSILRIKLSAKNKKDARNFAGALNRNIGLAQIKNPETIKLRDVAS